MKNSKHHVSANKRKELLIYSLFLLWPTVQFIIFYIIVNINSILLAFQEYSTTSYSFVFAKNPFENLKLAFTQFFSGTAGENGDGKEMLYSLLFYACSLCISVPLGLLFSYYVYKKFPVSGFYRLVLFLPQIVSAIVTVSLFRIFVKYPLPELIYKLTGNDKYLGGIGLLGDSDSAFWTVLFYNIWSGFGANILMYSNKMSTINPEIIEAANIDGATGFKEFYHIVLPQVYPTIVVFLIAGFSGIFSAQYNLFSLYPTYSNAKITSFGYYFFIYSQRGSGSSISGLQMYPYLSSLGLVISVIIIPLTFILRKLLTKFGPSDK